MRLLFVQDSLGTGGAERSNADLWYYLRDQPNFDIKIVVFEHRSVGIEDEILQAGFDVIFLKESNYLSQVKSLVKIIKSYKPDLVQSVLFKSAIRVRTAKHFIPFFHLEYIVNCSYSKVRFKDPKINNMGLIFFKYINRYTHKKGVDHFVALTEEVKNHASKHLNISPNKISVIPRGREVNQYLVNKTEIRLKIRKELNISENSILFVHVGRQEFQKAQIDLLKAIRLKDEELSARKAHFIFCGRDGNLSGEIKKFLLNNSFQTPIKWLGHRNDIQKILLASDVFVFPSLYEGLGGSLIEAQAASLPVIASNIKVFQEVVKENYNAKFFEVSNLHSLGEKLEEFASSEELRQEYGENSLQHFNKKFQIADVHNKLANLYKNLKK